MRYARTTTTPAASRRAASAIASLALLASTFTVLAVSVTGSPAEARTTQNASFSGLSCTGWAGVTAPTNAVSASFTLTGGGGEAGSGGPNRGTGGAGGRGGIVSGSIPVVAGQVLYARLGCGGAGSSGGAGYTTGGNGGSSAGGGGGSSALCLGTATASCGGGEIVAIAGGGGGGGRASDNGGGLCSGGSNGGAAGHAGPGGTNSGASTGGTTGENGGNGWGGGRGNKGGGGGGAGEGGGGGGGTGAAPTAGAGTAANSQGGRVGTGEIGNPGAGGPVHPTPPGVTATGGTGGNGDSEDSIGGGGGGGGFAGGAGGGNGDRSIGVCIGTYDGGGGGGGGALWVTGDATSVSFGTAAGNGSCTGNPGYGGNANGGDGCIGAITVTWTINEAPTGANVALPGQSVLKNAGTVINLANSDPDGDLPLTCSIVTPPTKGSLSGGTGCSRTYTGNPNTSGTDSFQYRVTDSLGAQSPIYTVNMTISNRAPTGAAASQNVDKGTGTAINLTNADPDNDSPLTCAITVAPTKGSLSGGTGCSRTYTGNANTSGTDTFQYTVSDAYGGTSTAYTVTLNIQNRIPTGANQSVGVDAGSPTGIALDNVDPDTDTLTCNPTTPTKGALTGSNCGRTYTSNAGSPNAGVGGADSFTYTVSDQNGGTSPAYTVDIAIANPDLSLIKAHSGRFQPGTGTGTYTLTVVNTTTAPAYGTTTITDTLPAGMAYRSFDAGTSGFSCSGDPGVSTTVVCTRATPIAEGFSGSLTLTVDVDENAASPGTNTAVISSLYELAATASDNTAQDITEVNHRPTTAPQSVGTDIDTFVDITLVANDIDGDALTYDVGPASNGSVSGSGPNRQYTPDTGFQGVDSFTYTVTDIDGLTSTSSTVTVYVGVSGVTGVITDDESSQPIPGAEVRLVDDSDPFATDPATVATAITDANGAYDFASQFPLLGAVPYGSYKIRFVDPTNDHIPEWWENAPNRTAATPIALDSSVAAAQYSAALVPGGRVQGTVRSTAGGNPTIDGLQVRLIKIGSSGSRASTTANGGQYGFELLTAGDYQLWFRDVNSGQWISEWYDEQPTQATAATITLAVGEQLLIDELISPVAPPPPPNTGTISGTVRSAAMGNAPIAGIQVRLYKAPYTTSSATTTDGNGNYTFTNLAPGSYKVWFRVVSGGAYVSEYYDDAPSLAAAQEIALNNTSSVADALLAPTAPPAPPNSATISGTVTQIDGFTPIAGLQVRLYVDGVATGSVATTTDINGNYTFTNRAPGQYQVWFRDVSNASWYSEWHLNKASQATADPVTGTNGQTTTVNASLVAK